MQARYLPPSEGILFTDLYQLTMAQLYFRQGLHEKTVQFDHFFRSYPDYGDHKAGYCINAGLECLVDWMQQVAFRDGDLEYLRSQTGRSGQRTFDDDFLAWLRKYGNFDGISLRAIPEGRVVHPNCPLTVAQGPLAMAQILESPLLNQLNYQTLIATKAARISEAGRRNLLLEFGMRRAQGKGANAGARAALIGGANFTSNTGISYELGYPPKGTHAHSMVQVFLALGEGELEAFRAYADLYPDDCLLLVDTVNTLESGVPNAIKVFEELRQRGHQPVGIRLDSGDLAYLSIQAAKMLDEAGFPEAKIVLSNQLDELVIWQILSQIQDEAPYSGVDPDSLINRLVYGVGTHLITSTGDSSLDGVYKLVAVSHQGEWLPALKISESRDKILNPGHKLLWRVYDTRGKAVADLMSLDDEDPRSMDEITFRHPVDHTKYRTCQQSNLQETEPLLVDILRDGQLVYDLPSLEDIRDQRHADLDRLDSGVRRFMRPHIYHVSLTEKLWNLKQSLIHSIKTDQGIESTSRRPE
ncbi:nicotinate phosphoribosyltransferase [candidate division KSB3 bacterium]|uniref:Nicotinate phosphoribosyltransferase n=1 Tax=candidate division KSB3 bacterium TaxID=2044937 RepID=A0A9D5Q476_9BACT|nr:nicotinate phosphoribosyltransferase [candidate division KSB3 bacterium]MBD3323265.1 nicotinate phosphoribosyltransferase [candidate division KSB3 bacterium]